MLTAFGKLCRKLRIDHGELLKDMADKLKVTPAYLSAVEIGKRNVPQDWPEKITALYLLDSETSEALHEAARKSQLNLKIDLKGVEDADKDLVLAFAREFKELDEKDKDKIKAILLKNLF
jgi:transcriptional regulator with XRE-family HTH domain